MPRTWADAVKRSATYLTLQFLRGGASTSKSESEAPAALGATTEPSRPRTVRVTSQAEFRRQLKMSKDQLLYDEEGRCFRFIEIGMNGDCGFTAIALSMNIANGLTSGKKPTTSPSNTIRYHRFMFPLRSNKKLKQLNRTLFNNTNPNDNNHDEQRKRRRRQPAVLMKPEDVRLAMSRQILKAKHKYLHDKDKYGCYYIEADYNRLLNDVKKPGISGHWLGSILGNMEHVILSHALHISIYLYQFDLQKQTVRQFDDAKVDNPKCHVYLFFTGPGASGHFDALVLMPPPSSPVSSNTVTPQTSDSSNTANGEGDTIRQGPKLLL